MSISKTADSKHKSLQNQITRGIRLAAALSSEQRRALITELDIRPKSYTEIYTSIKAKLRVKKIRFEKGELTYHLQSFLEAGLVRSVPFSEYYQKFGREQTVALSTTRPHYRFFSLTDDGRTVKDFLTDERVTKIDWNEMLHLLGYERIGSYKRIDKGLHVRLALVKSIDEAPYGITRGQLSERLGIGIYSVDNNLRALRKSGLVESKKGRYAISTSTTAESTFHTITLMMAMLGVV